MPCHDDRYQHHVVTATNKYLLSNADVKVFAAIQTPFINGPAKRQSYHKQTLLKNMQYVEIIFNN